MVIAASTFEGPEKRLKIVFSSAPPKWRSNDDGHWDRVVNAGKAHIISRISTELLDAYLLSESSLFVWDDRMLMITCGQTTPIDALGTLFAPIDLPAVSGFHYERNNFVFPEQQPSDFQKEIAPILGRFSGRHQRLGSAEQDHVHVFCAVSAEEGGVGARRDASLQILMHDLDSSMMNAFHAEPSKIPGQIRECSGLDRIYPDMRTDSHLFAPYGYSLNGIRGGNYFAVHVTPQREGSYASFETNVEDEDFSKTICEVLTLFKPERFSLVYRVNGLTRSLPWHPDAVRRLSGYHMMGEDNFQAKWNYRVSFMNWAR